MLSSVLFTLVCIGIPTGSAVYFIHRRDGTFLTFLTGAICFLIAQPLLRIPLLGILGRHSTWFRLLPYTDPVLYYLILGFTAGLFEESARLIGLKCFRRGHTSWIDGIAYGLGHGGVEAAWIFFSSVLSQIQTGQTGIGLLIGAWERIFAVMVQIGLSMVVLCGVRTGKKRFLALAVALHTLVDFLIIIGNIWIVEGLIAIEGILFMIFVIKCRKKLK